MTGTMQYLSASYMRNAQSHIAVRETDVQLAELFRQRHFCQQCLGMAGVVGVASRYSCIHVCYRLRVWAPAGIRNTLTQRRIIFGKGQ